MNMLYTILRRRSVRDYTDEPIPDEKLDAVLYAGLAAPSSKNRKSWEFIVVREKSTLQQLCDCRPSAGRLLSNCDAAIVVAANSELVDVWIEDCSAAMAQMHLMADALGIGSCWLQVRLRTTPDGKAETQAVIRDLLAIPANYSVLAILTLGMPAQHPGARSIEDLPLEKIHRERF